MISIIYSIWDINSINITLSLASACPCNNESFGKDYLCFNFLYTFSLNYTNNIWFNFACRILDFEFLTIFHWFINISIYIIFTAMVELVLVKKWYLSLQINPLVGLLATVKWATRKKNNILKFTVGNILKTKQKWLDLPADFHNLKRVGGSRIKGRVLL